MDWMKNLLAVLGMAYGLLGLMSLISLVLVLVANPYAPSMLEATENLALVVLGGTMGLSKELADIRKSGVEKG